MIPSQSDSGTFKGITPRPVTCLCPKPILLRGLVKTHRNKGPYPLPLPFTNFIDPSLKLKNIKRILLPFTPPPPNTHSHKLFVPFLKAIYFLSKISYMYRPLHERKFAKRKIK